MNPESRPFQDINCMGLRTNLIYDQFFSQIKETPDYIAVKTPARPSYFWGNYLILKQAPQSGELEQIENWLEAEIGPKTENGFAAMTYPASDANQPLPTEFLKVGYTAERHKILCAQSLVRPRQFNDELEVKPFTDSDWAHYSDIHFTPNWGYGSDSQQIEFLNEEAQAFRRLVASGQAQRFGVFVDQQMIAELGVYWQADLARFHNVGTHRDFRRQGACSTLVYSVAKQMLSKPDLKTLVMEADADYHAAAIYESIGFEAKQYRIELEWKDPARFG